MALVIRDVNAPPPERFHFPTKAYGSAAAFDVDASNYNQLFENIRKHCESNGKPIPSNQEVVDYLCRETHVSCYDDETHQPLINKLTQGLPFTPTTRCCGSKT